MVFYQETVKKNERKETAQRKKTNLPSHTLGGNGKEYTAPVKLNVIQMARSSNPDPKNDGIAFDSWGTTAHHIISRDVLLGAYNKLDDAQKAEVAAAARPGDWKKDDGRTFGIVATDIQCIEWPQGNLFYGPHESIRAEKSDKKEDMDVDAKYFVSKAHFQRLVEFNQEITNAGKNKEMLKSVLIRFYLYAKMIPAAPFDETMWREVRDKQSADSWLEERGHGAKNVYIKIDVIRQETPLLKDGDKYIQRHPRYLEIYKYNGDYKYLDKKISSIEMNNKLCIRKSDTSGVVDYLEGLPDAPLLPYTSYVPWTLTKDFQLKMLSETGWVETEENGEQIIDLIRLAYNKTNYKREFAAIYRHYKQQSEEASAYMEEVKDICQHSRFIVISEDFKAIQKNYTETLKNYTWLIMQFKNDIKILENRKNIFLSNKEARDQMDVRLRAIADRITKLRLYDLSKTIDSLQVLK